MSSEPALNSDLPVWFRRTRVLDYASFGFSVAAVVVTLIIFALQGGGLSEPFALLISLAGVVLSRRYKWSGLMLTQAAVLLAAITTPPIAEWTIVVFTLFSVTLRGVSAIRSGAIVAILTFWALFYAGGMDLLNGAANTSLVTAVAAAATGSAIRAHQQYWYALEQRTRDAITSREAEANRRVAEERVRIARDLHDVIGHEIAAISMHIGAAEVRLPTGAEHTRQSLRSARGGVQSVLRETQRTLKSLRSDGELESAPVVDVSQVPALLDSFRSIGLLVVEHGELPSIEDAVVSATVYRLIQEALTNAKKHGHGAVSLEFALADGVLAIHATNAKGPLGTRGGGYGLVGMRERASSVGGQIAVSENVETFRLMINLRLDGTATA